MKRRLPHLAYSRRFSQSAMSNHAIFHENDTDEHPITRDSCTNSVTEGRIEKALSFINHSLEYWSECKVNESGSIYMKQ